MSADSEIMALVMLCAKYCVIAVGKCGRCHTNHDYYDPGARFSKNRKIVITQLRRIYDRKIVITELWWFYDFSKIGPLVRDEWCDVTDVWCTHEKRERLRWTVKGLSAAVHRIQSRLFYSVYLWWPVSDVGISYFVQIHVCLFLILVVVLF